MSTEQEMKEEIARLKAEVERLKKFSDEALAHIAKEERKSRERLDMVQAEVERLRKAGDSIIAEAYAMANKSDWPYTFDILVEEWNVAKEGKPTK